MMTSSSDHRDRRATQRALAAAITYPSSPIDWFAITPTEETLVWRGLAAFVEMIVVRYNLAAEIRPCWWRHDEAVDELTALWQTRAFHYQGGAGLNAAMSWLDTLAKSRGRLRDCFVSCRDSHVDVTMMHWASDAERHEFIEFVGPVDCDAVQPSKLDKSGS